MSSTTIFIVVAIFFALGLVGKLLGLSRRSKEIEKTLDYSKMKEWEDDEET